MELIDTQIGKIVEELKVALLSHYPIAYIPTNDMVLIHDILYSEDTHGAIIPRIQCKGGTSSSPELICLKADKLFDNTNTGIASISDNYFFNASFKIEDLKIPSIIVVIIHEWKNIPSSLTEFVKTYIGLKLGKGYTKPETINIIRRSLCIVVTPTNQPIPFEFVPYVKKINIPVLTDEEIRNEIIEKFSSVGYITENITNSYMNQIVVSLRGFTKSKIRSIFDELIATLYIQADRINIEGIMSTIRAEKKAMMEDCPGLKWENVGNAKAAGLGNITKWLNERRDIFADPNKARQKNIDIPNGLLISGIPGSGKSLMAKTAASLLDLPLISLDMGALLGSLMGQSEHNLIEALHMAEQMAPCILWIDEIEKAFSGSAQSSSSSDGGVSRRMFGKFLTWMQEKSSACFVFTTSNDISALPPELFRSERFDRKFYTFMPTAQECAMIFSQIIKKENKQYKEHLSNLPKGILSQKAQFLFDIEAESSQFWLDVINTSCAPHDYDLTLYNIENDNVEKDNLIENGMDHIYRWKDNRQPNFKLLTGADISALIKEIKFRLYKEISPNSNSFAALYNATSIKYTAISIMQSSEFKPYGETNLKDIINCFYKLYSNQFVSASGSCILDFSMYDESSHTYIHDPIKVKLENRYDKALYYVLVGGINKYSQHKKKQS